jgi:hypothetical protein
MQENVRSKIQNLLRRIVALEECFDSPPLGDVVEQNRRDEVVR